MSISAIGSLELSRSSDAIVSIYTTRLCGFCRAAKHLLQTKKINFEEIPVDGDRAMRQELVQRTGQRTVPQIWIGKKHVGGFTDLAKLEQSGQLDEVLAQV